jgi:hypothetical protein
VIRKFSSAFFLSFLLTLTAAHAADAPDSSWAQSAQAFVPQGYVAGAVYRTDLKSMTGALALFRAGSDDPKTPGSAFDWITP